MSYLTFFKKIEMDEVTESYLQKTISSLLPTDHIIVTDHHNRVFDIIEKKQYFKGKGIYISGPPGSGKSTTCVYLYQVLKEKNIPFVVFSTGSLAPINKAMLQRYLCEGVQGNCLHFTLILLQQISRKYCLRRT